MGVTSPARSVLKGGCSVMPKSLSERFPIARQQRDRRGRYSVDCQTANGSHAHHRTTLLHRRGSACLSRRAQARQARNHPHQADGDPARPAAWPIRRAWRCRCCAIAENPDPAYDYTAKGNLVAVISNGTAILGLGDLGALASKPVMEGKAVLFKRFADVDAIDLEVDTTDVDAFINRGALSGPQLRRHQSGRHQGAGLLHHRGAAARDDGHSGLP